MPGSVGSGSRNLLLGLFVGLLAVAAFLASSPRDVEAVDGDVCGVFSSTGANANVGEHFYVLARIQDNFKVNFDIDFHDTDGNNVIDTAEIGWTDEVLLRSLSAEITNTVGEATIIDRIDDDDDVADPANWWDFGPYGDAEEASLSPLTAIPALKILTVLAFDGDVEFGTLSNAGSLDISEFFMSKATDSAAASALTDCGSAMVSVDASFAGLTVVETAKLLGQITACILDSNGDNDECLALADLLDSIDGTADDITNYGVNFQLDGWSEISVVCTKPGAVQISFEPNSSDPFATGDVIDISCISDDPVLTVHKDFSTSATSFVTIEVKCTNGATAGPSKSAADNPDRPAVFIITNVPSGGTSCTARERPVPSGFVENRTGCTNISLTSGQSRSCTITNTPSAPPTGTIEVRNVLSPTNASGRFDLRIDNVVQFVNATHGSKTAKVTVSAGTHSVGETAASGTTITQYTTSIECRNAATNAVLATGSPTGSTRSINVNVPAGVDVLCRITNTRL